MPEKQIWFTLRFFGIAVFPILSIFYHCIANSSLFQKCCAQLPHRFRSPLSFSLLLQSRKASGNTQFHLTLSVDGGCTQKILESSHSQPWTMQRTQKLQVLLQQPQDLYKLQCLRPLPLPNSLKLWKYFEINNENTDKKISLQQQRHESSKVSILSSQKKFKKSFNRGARSRKTSFAPLFSVLKIDCRS